MVDDRQPVIVAVGQVTERSELVSPVELMARACERALGSRDGLGDRIEHVSVVNVLSGAGPAPASDLCARLALEPHAVDVTTVGGNSPQWLVSRLADSIWRGDLDIALVAGGEAQSSNSRERRAVEWERSREEREAAQIRGEADPVVGDGRPGFGEAELGAGLLAPVHVYPLFESAVAHRNGRSFAEQRDHLGSVMAPFTEVAASHPQAWFPIARTPAELSDVTKENRLVSEPYPKRMCAILAVDQAAAVVVCSYAAAKELGLADSAVFCISGADANEVWFPSERPDLGRLPGFTAAAAVAMSAAGTGMDSISRFDVYSCFPCVVEMAAEALRIGLDDPRRLTVTGGLPYFGGPGNAYTLFGIATMVEHLRGDVPGSKGFVSGIGWYATKHSVGIYSNVPKGHGSGGWARGNTERYQTAIDRSALRVTTDVPGTGSDAEVVAATVAYDAAGTVTSAPLVATLQDGRRVAATPADTSELSAMRGVSLVGTTVRVFGSPPRYRMS